MINCAFCDEFVLAMDDTWLLAKTEDRVVLPTIGCVAEGYLLYMPKEHTLAFADLDAAELARCQEDLEEIRAELERRYGPVIVAEHGPRECDLGAGCCDHAHMHLIPVPDSNAVRDRYVRHGGERPAFDALPDCLGSIDTAYVYLSPAPGVHQVWPADGFPRQWVRRVCAEAHGRAEAWDWRDYPFDEERLRTYQALRNQLSAPARVSAP